jgi:hypothetical protein
VSRTSVSEALLGRGREAFLRYAPRRARYRNRHIGLLLPMEYNAMLATCLTDPVMASLGSLACVAAESLCDDSINEYARRRPGRIRRNFSNVRQWLFD